MFGFKYPPSEQQLMRKINSARRKALNRRLTKSPPALTNPRSITGREEQSEKRTCLPRPKLIHSYAQKFYRMCLPEKAFFHSETPASAATPPL